MGMSRRPTWDGRATLLRFTCYKFVKRHITRSIAVERVGKPLEVDATNSVSGFCEIYCHSHLCRGWNRGLMKLLPTLLASGDRAEVVDLCS